MAGLFDTTDAKGAPPGLVPAADWVPTRILLPAGPLVYHPGEVSSRRIILDIKRGALLTAGHFTELPDLSLQVHTLRLVSLDDRGLGLQLIQLEIEHGEVDLTFEASFEGMHLGLVAETIGQGYRRVAHTAFGQRPGHRDSTVAAGRRPGSFADRARRLRIHVDLENPPWANRVFPAPCRHSFAVIA